jgi:hypothetical protein
VTSATIDPEAARANAAAFLVAIGLRPVLVFLLRRLADRIENGRDARPFDIGLAIERLAGADLSHATRKAYAGALTRLHRWLAGRRLDDRLLAAHVGELFEQDLSPESARHVVYAVRRGVADAARLGLPFSDNPAGPETAERLGRFRREAAGRGTGQVRGVTWEEADRMCELAEAEGAWRACATRR